MNPTRREFAKALTAFSVLTLPAWARGRELACDVAIIGGGVGGCAAALAACRAGLKVVLNEHPWIEGFGSTEAYRQFRRGVRRYYAENYRLRTEAAHDQRLNPGGGSVSVLTHEPRVALAVIEQMLQPYRSAGRLVVLSEHVPVAADVERDRVRSVKVRGRRDGTERVIEAPYFLDATETGELLPLAGVEFVTGAESRRQTGELHAPEQAQPTNHQAFTVCFALGYEEGVDHTIDKPNDYEFWRDYVPQLRPAWPGKLLSWTTSHPVTVQPRQLGFDPTLESRAGDVNLWLYRRIVRKDIQDERLRASDVTLVNWPQNDYWLGNLYGGTPEEAARHLKRGRELSLALVYWMQTEAPRPDGGAGWRGLHLRPDITGTEDGLAKYPYIRESRRIQAEFTVVEEHVGTDARVKATGKSKDEVTAEPFADSVGVGSYRIDLHPSSGGDNYIDVSSLPFQIPLGALIPKRVENVLAAAKNLGVTHITNGCYRLHPVEWNIGESAGALAAHCVAHQLTPRAVRADKARLGEFQARLREQGVETAWPRLTPR
jgi:hypothetical protein